MKKEVHMKLNIPKDIKRHVAFRIVPRVIICLLLITIIVTLVTLNLEIMLKKGISQVILICAVSLVLVCVVTGVPKKLIDSTWCGEIVDQKTKNIIQSKMTGANYKTGFDAMGTKMSEYRNTLTVTVKTDNGANVSFVAYDGTAGDGGAFGAALVNYKVGTRVLHVYGTKYLQPLEDERDTVKCIVCGEENKNNAEKCETCGHTLRLIKKDETMWFYG